MLCVAARVLALLLPQLQAMLTARRSSLRVAPMERSAGLRVRRVPPQEVRPALMVQPALCWPREPRARWVPGLLRLPGQPAEQRRALLRACSGAALLRALARSVALRSAMARTSARLVAALLRALAPPLARSVAAALRASSVVAPEETAWALALAHPAAALVLVARARSVVASAQVARSRRWSR